MLELIGTIEKIEKSSISNVDLIFINTEKNQTQMRLELVNEINPFKEDETVKIIFDTKPASKNDQKLVLNAYIYSISKVQAINNIIISIGGLQLKIETPKEYDDFKIKKEINIQFY
ncbi:MAG: DNA-directed RNA polymerase subunit G [Candidatus Helarchaeota archaeon]|nr:DNA-directed RNA polymerase subunit G [Candidatus Helarchaeota archaeon]